MKNKKMNSIKSRVKVNMTKGNMLMEIAEDIMSIMVKAKRLKHMSNKRK